MKKAKKQQLEQERRQQIHKQEEPGFLRRKNMEHNKKYIF